MSARQPLSSPSLIGAWRELSLCLEAMASASLSRDSKSSSFGTPFQSTGARTSTLRFGINRAIPVDCTQPTPIMEGPATTSLTIVQSVAQSHHPRPQFCSASPASRSLLDRREVCESVCVNPFLSSFPPTSRIPERGSPIGD